MLWKYQISSFYSAVIQHNSSRVSSSTRNESHRAWDNSQSNALYFDGIYGRSECIWQSDGFIRNTFFFYLEFIIVVLYLHYSLTLAVLSNYNIELCQCIMMTQRAGFQISNNGCATGSITQSITSCVLNPYSPNLSTNLFL